MLIATDFEFRHQTLLHLSLVGLALLTYVINPADIVWALVRHHSDARSLERMAFALGAMIMLGSAVLETWTTAFPSGNGRLLARFLSASALGFLLPLSGTVILLCGETLLISRLLLRNREAKTAPNSQQYSSIPWPSAFRSAASKWGLAASMLLLALTLQDRIAEIAAALSFLFWAALNVRPKRT